jgi:VWFA-related protein
LILLGTATISYAQDIQDDGYKLGVDVELVQLPVSVVDKGGRPVGGLKQEDFAIYEDKVLQNISLFTNEDVPLSVGLVIDASASMDSKRRRVNTAAMTFLRESNPGDETAIVSFGDKVNLEQDFTADMNLLRRTLNRISSSGGTALYDAVVRAARHLDEGGSHKRRVLIVVTDGEDNASKYTLEEAVTALRDLKVLLYIVGLLRPDPTFDSDTGRKSLERLAQTTGGVSYFPKDVRNVEDVCKQIARDLRDQYTIGYKPSNEKLDGSWRRVLVQVNLPKTMTRVKVRTKEGYYAPVARERREGAQVLSDK